MRILIVEDERKLAGVLRRGLEEQGYAVDTAYDGEEGLVLAETEPYDLIVLDLMLPTLDGLAVCRQLRAHRRTMPVLMLTARDTVDDRVVGLDSGADDYLVKPFAFRELLARVRALLRRDSPSKDAVLRIADLEVNTASHEVRRAGKPVELTSKEYAVLEYFARNPNRVLTRTQIAEHVWNYDFVAESNVVDVYVRTLRRKLHDDRDPRLLRTVRGTGYQLRAPPP
jgi:two-component system, OmpR family, copper resistance phosphate regulon response regulator CusR